MELVLYGCNDCKYCTLRKFDYDRHLKSKSHHKLFYYNKKTCYRCGFIFKNKQGLDRHLARSSERICNDTFFIKDKKLIIIKKNEEPELFNFNCYQFKGNKYKYLFAISDIDTFLPLQPLSILLFKNYLDRNNNDILQTFKTLFINSFQRRVFFVDNDVLYYKYKNNYKRSISLFAKFELDDLKKLTDLEHIENAEFIITSIKNEISLLLR